MIHLPSSLRRIPQTPWPSFRLDAPFYFHRRSYAGDKSNGDRQFRLRKVGGTTAGRHVGRARRRDGFNGQGKKPSLVEQLFPEESKRFQKSNDAAQIQPEVPRLPLHSNVASVPSHSSHIKRVDEDSLPKSEYQERLMRQMDDSGPQTSVLVLNNASKNLTIEDFRRLIPQGRHIEGWTLEKGDILSVIPGRNLADLSHENYYFLLFSSVLSAFTYQGHVTNIHRLVSAHLPSSLLSPLPPGPSQIVDGLNAHASMEAYSLTAPLQPLNLRQLKPPLSPLVQSIVRNRGYAALRNRPNKMPFEARLTLYGPQLSVFTIRRILEQSGRERALGWGGSDEMQMPISKWEPESALSPMDDNAYSRLGDVLPRDEDQQLQADLYKTKTTRRSQQSVYIIGFATERAMLSFVQYWHKRPLMQEKLRSVNEQMHGESPPIANVEVLW